MTMEADSLRKGKWKGMWLLPTVVIPIWYLSFGGRKDTENPLKVAGRGDRTRASLMNSSNSAVWFHFLGGVAH